MIFINPQWQGSGVTDGLKKGAETLKQYFKTGFVEIPLSDSSLDMVNNIVAYKAIIEQAKYFKKIIEDANLSTFTTIGGDCGIEIMPISYLNKLHSGDLFVVWIDAHPDLNTPESSPSKNFHGMPLRALLGEGDKQIKDLLFSFLHPEQICFVGLRDADDPEKEYIEANNITSLPSAEYYPVEQEINNRKFTNIYIHLDLDVLDREEFEFALFPTDNGLPVQDVTQLIKNLKTNFKIAGICVTESIAASLDSLTPIKSILDQVKL